MKVHKPPGVATGSGYTKLWFIRSMLIASGVQHLEVGSTTVEEFCSAFPDAKRWMSIFPKKQSITKAMAEVCYSGRPEIITMFLCVIGNKDMNFDLAWLQAQLPDIIAVRQAVEKERNMIPTPAFCCLSVQQAVKVSQGSASLLEH